MAHILIDPQQNWHNSTYARLAWVLLLWVIAACNSSTPHFDPTSFVNPFIGTGGHGHTFPGATMPFGMVQLSPDTRLEGWDGCSGYHYSDSIVYGFSHTHLSGTGVGDYCDILFKPCIGKVYMNNGYKSSPEKGYASYFNKKTEVATPGFYSLQMNEGIDVELTATPRAGFHKYIFRKADNAHIILDLTHRDKLLDANIEIINDSTIAGFRRSSSWATDQFVFFIASFSKSFKDYKITQDSIILSPDSIALRGAKASFIFDLSNGDSLLMKVGISPVDIEGAKRNLSNEIPHWDFDQSKENARKAWGEELRKIRIESEDKNEKTIFYSALYHTMIAPNIFSDVDARYRKALPKDKDQRTKLSSIGQLENGQEQYTIFSLWDTYRATHPLYTIIDQKRTNAYINTFLRQYKDGGQLPVWELSGNYTGCMIGYHSVSVIADAYAKGIRNYDANLALEAMKHSAEMSDLGLSEQVEYGYIPCNREPESVSKTLEYAYDDWCIATLAKQLGDEKAYSIYNERAQYYKNLYNPDKKFLMGRSNGGWYGPFFPEEVNFNYTEANGWQYSLAVPQDVQGLIKLMGGKKAFLNHLDQLFTTNSKTSGREQADITGLIGQYAHGNEPSHHMAYLYNYVQQPWKTQEMVSRIMDEMYQNEPDGLSGNEDCGQMSAWYVFSALGFYPVCPGSDEYVIGTPRFKNATIQLENGKKFTITSKNFSDGALYIQSASLNGKMLNTSYIKHADIMNGGTVEFTMGTTPNKEWGSNESSIPNSYIAEEPIAIAPSFVALSQTFEDTMSIKIISPEKDVNIHYTLDGSRPTQDSPIYLSPIQIKNSTQLRAIAINKKGTTSKVVNGNYLKIDGGRSITLNTNYANQYSAGGDKALINFLRGGTEFRTGNWQGYEGVNLDAIIDLGKPTTIQKVTLGCLQDIKSWIWFPTKVEIFLSNNGEHFKSEAVISNDFSDREYGSFQKNFEAALSGKKARYIKIIASNYGKCPDWHLGAGGTAWLFVDEISID